MNTRKNGFVVALTLGFAFNAAVIAINVYFAMGLNTGAIVQTIVFDVNLLCASMAISVVVNKVYKSLKHCRRSTLVALAIGSYLASVVGALIIALAIQASISSVAIGSSVGLCTFLFFEMKNNKLWF